ncbi:MAG: hypothetical protein QM756_33215 [Polyangiaceae bacterium]
MARAEIEAIVIAGHFGLAAAVKGTARQTPLWALMLACQWLDVVFVPLFAAGVEGLEPVAGAKAGAYGGAVIHADYTHSLLGALVLSAVFGALFVRRYGKRSAVVLGAVAFSHWLLDLPLHRADMPLLPGGAGELPKLGFGLWQYPSASALLELVLVLGGAFIYWRAARDVAATNAPLQRRAVICGIGVMASCLLVLGMNLLGF